MKNIVCKIRGHQFISVKKSHIQIKEYECSNCKEKFTSDGYGQIVKLSSYWEENNLLFERIMTERTLNAS